jgi:hydrogenase maturation protease
MQPSTENPAAILVLGIGNVLWADEGFGVRCAEALAARYRLPAHVDILDGGTQGLYLLPYVQAASKLLILDAVDYGLEPGSVHRVTNGEVPRYLGAKKLSLHQTGFQEVLALADLMGKLPAQITLIGCQPETLDDFGGSLRPKLRDSLEVALEQAVAQLSTWGAQPVLRDTPSRPADAPASLSLDRYESERPSEATAYRRGDARFVALALTDRAQPAVREGKP